MKASLYKRIETTSVGVPIEVRWKEEVEGTEDQNAIAAAARPPRPPRGGGALCQLPQGSMLPCSPPAALSTCSYAAATAASCCSLVGPTAVGTKSPLGLGGLLPSGARSPMAVGSVHHCRCLPWIGAWTGKGLEGGPAAGPAACRPAASLSCQFSENQLSLGPTSATVSQSPGWQTPPRPRPGTPSRPPPPRSSPRSPAPTCSSWWASRSARSTRS